MTSDSLPDLDERLGPEIRAFLEREALRLTRDRPPDNDVAAAIRRHASRGATSRTAVAVAAVAAVVAVVTGLTVLAPRSSERAGAAREVAGVASCAEGSWPDVPATCRDAQASVSLGMTVDRTRIWLTSLGVVDQRFGTGSKTDRAGVDPSTPVWVFVYDGYRAPILHADASGRLVRSDPENRVLHVTDATDLRTIAGAFVYLYGWSELPRPGQQPPATMPTIDASPPVDDRPLDPGIQPVSASQPSADAAAAISRCLPSGMDVGIIGAMGRMERARDIWRYVPLPGSVPELESDTPAWVIVFRGAIPTAVGPLGADHLVDATCVVVGDERRLLATGPSVDVYGAVRQPTPPLRKPLFKLPSLAP